MNETKLKIGLPKMHLEPGEQRVFLPEFVGYLQEIGFEPSLEVNFGASIGLTD